MNSQTCGTPFIPSMLFLFWRLQPWPVREVVASGFGCFGSKHRYQGTTERHSTFSFNLKQGLLRQNLRLFVRQNDGCPSLVGKVLANHLMNLTTGGISREFFQRDLFTVEEMHLVRMSEKVSMETPVFFLGGVRKRKKTLIKRIKENGDRLGFLLDPTWTSNSALLWSNGSWFSSMAKAKALRTEPMATAVGYPGDPLWGIETTGSLGPWMNQVLESTEAALDLVTPRGSQLPVGTNLEISYSQWLFRYCRYYFDMIIYIYIYYIINYNKLMYLLGSYLQQMKSRMGRTRNRTHIRNQYMI